MTTSTVAVVGLGYVGLPLAVLAKEKGWHVIGFDIAPEKVAAITAGKSPLRDEALQQALTCYPIDASTDPGIIKMAEVIVIAVPTPVTGLHQPDLEPLKSAVTAILPHLQKGQLLSVESTINPGVMDEVVRPILNTRPELQLDVVHCPERINPGDPQWTVRNIPRVIGGYTAAAAARGKIFYEAIIEAPVTVMQSVAEAEAVKILENTFRDVNIAFINEMAKSFDALGIDIVHVIKGAATKPFAFMPHYPGNGVGGHCISVDPYYMIERGRQAGFDHQFLKLARTINDSMPSYAVSLLQAGAREQSLDLKTERVALLGLAYKKNIDDIRESPALVIQQLLTKEGIAMSVFDPYVPHRSTVSTLAEALRDVRIVVLATDHSEFTQKLTPEYLKKAGVTLVVDGKNALDADGIAAAGILYKGIGRARS